MAVKSKITFSSDALYHIYERAKDHGVLFYSLEDRLVYYTLAAVKAKKHKIRVSAASLMYTHTHLSVFAGCLDSILNFLHDLNSSYTRFYNHYHHRKGELFEKPVGRAQKLTSKSIRSAEIYIFNNHFEKGLCTRAEQCRWALLAYASSDSPFSQPLHIRSASNRLRRAMKLVDRRVRALTALEYKDLTDIFSSLDEKESEQFTDYVISRYSLIDFSIPIAHFGSLENLLAAVHSTSGSEYDISEEFYSFKDTSYEKLIKFARSECFLNDIFILSDDERRILAEKIHKGTKIALFIISRFLHFKI